MTKQQDRNIKMILNHFEAGNYSTAARQLSAMIRANISPVQDRSDLMALAVKLGLHAHPDFRC